MNILYLKYIYLQKSIISIIEMFAVDTSKQKNV